MRGRKPKPTRLKILQGNPGRRPINGEEPQPDLTSTDPPPGLTKEALEIWDVLAPQLISLQLLTELDRGHLARACKLEALGNTLLRKAVKKPIVFTASNGHQPAAELTAALKCFEQCDKLMFRFGITPVERTRLKVPQQTKENPFQKFLREKRKHDQRP